MYSMRPSKSFLMACVTLALTSEELLLLLVVECDGVLLVPFNRDFEDDDGGWTSIDVFCSCNCILLLLLLLVGGGAAAAVLVDVGVGVGVGVGAGIHARSSRDANGCGRGGGGGGTGPSVLVVMDVMVVAERSRGGRDDFAFNDDCVCCMVEVLYY